MGAVSHPLQINFWKFFFLSIRSHAIRNMRSVTGSRAEAQISISPTHEGR